MPMVAHGTARSVRRARAGARDYNPANDYSATFRGNVIRRLASRIAVAAGGSALASCLYFPRGVAGRSRSYRRFVIAAYARSGSTMLVSALDGHPQVKCYSEIFHGDHAMFMTAGYPEGNAWIERIRRHSPQRFLDTFVFRGYKPRIQQVGFKVFPDQARDRRFAASVRALLSDHDVCVIHLRRRNRLAMYLSLVRAQRSDAWTTFRSERYDESPLRLEPEACREAFEAHAADEAFFAGLLAPRPHLEIFYEDVMAAPQRLFETVTAYLEVDESEFAPRIGKQRSTPLRAAVENFDELATAFAGSEYANCFAEDEV